MKRIVSMLLMLTMLIGVIPMFGVAASAATVLTISRPSDWQHISKNSPPTLKWSKISGAAGYTVTVKNDVTGKYYAQNEWTTSTSYSLADLFDEKLGSSEYPRLKIWVGAMKSTDISQGLISTDTQDSVIVVVAEKPDISVSTPTNITSDGATLKVTVNKNYGSDILDAGFYIGTSSTRSSATKYSLSEYGPSQVSNSGTMTMNITGLEPDTKYYCWGYAENYVGETVSSSYKTFWTEEDEDAPGPKFNQKPTLTLSIDGNKISGDIYGTYVPGDEIYLKFTANYSDHVFVETSSSQLTFTNPKGTVVSNGTFVEKTSSSTYTPKSYTNGSVFQVTVKVPEGIPTGDYTISVTATDGVYDCNNGSIAGTSYYTAAEKSVTVRVGKKASGGDNRTIPTSVSESNAMVIYSNDKKAKSVVVGKVRHIPQVSTDSFYCAEYWKSGGYDTSSQSGSLCTRAVYSMALSFLGVDCTPGEMARLMQTTGDIPTVYYDNVTAKLQSTYPGLSTAKSGKLSDLFENYANDSSYSPVYVRFGKYGDSVGHAALVIGRDTINPNKYYCVEPSFSGTGSSTVHVVTMIVNDDGTVATDYTWSSCRGRSITACYQWQYSGSTSESHPQTYTITYNYNYDGGSIKTETKNHGETYTISETIIPTRPSTETSTTITSYKFYGWATSEEGNVMYQPGDTYTQNSNLTLYAQWTTSVSNKPQAGVTVYNIIYDANGGNNAPDPSNGVKAGTTITLSTTKPTRSGYTFLGWSLDKNDDVADYQPGDSYTVTGATTLYAVWNKQSSGGGSSGGESNQTYIISGEITSYTSSGNYSIVLYDANGEEYSVMVSRTPDYEFEVTPGRYTLEVSKAKHITYRCDIVINSTDITQNIILYLLGDINGDGIFDYYDVSKLFAFYRGKTTLDKSADTDINGDGIFDYYDVSKLFAIYRGKAAFD